MGNGPTLFERDDEELIDIYEEIFHSLTHSNSWVNRSVDIQNNTPTKVVQNLKESSNTDRGIDYLFKYSDSSYSRALLELRIPSMRTGDILIGSLSYKANSEALNHALSSDKYKKVNKTLAGELTKNNKYITLNKPSEELPSSDLLWIKMSNKESEPVEFDTILTQLEYIVSVTDEFYSDKLTTIIIDKAQEFGKCKSQN